MKPTDIHLSRQLGKFDAVMLVIGNVIGIGIFTTAGYVAGKVGSPAEFFLIWILGGFYALFGALTYAELASRFPLAGGDYHYLKQAYHPLLGFLFGWAAFMVTYTGSIATIAVGFATYFLNLLPESIRVAEYRFSGLFPPLTAGKSVAILVVLMLTVVNTRGLRKGAFLQNIFTVSGILILVGTATWGFSTGNGSFSHFQPFWSSADGSAGLDTIGLALLGVIFTYSGWTVVVYIAGEVREPAKNIPGAMAGAIALIMALYLLMNAVYLYAFPLPEMKDVVDIGFRTLTKLAGSPVGGFFSLLIMLAVLSTLNANILSGPRIYYAMARENRFFRWAGELNPKRQIPEKGLWMQFAWTVLLIYSGTFNQLLTYTVFAMVLFSFLSAVSLFVLRAKGKNKSAAYRIWGYPVVPGAFCLAAGAITLNTFFGRPLVALTGMGIILTGIPFFYYWRKRREV